MDFSTGFNFLKEIPSFIIFPFIVLMVKIPVVLLPQMKQSCPLNWTLSKDNTQIRTFLFDWILRMPPFEDSRLVQLAVVMSHRTNRANLIGLYDSRKVAHIEALLPLCDCQSIISVAL